MLSEAKTRSIIIQGMLVTAVVAFAALLVSTTFANLRARGIPIGFDFLTMPSRIIISEAIFTYKSRDPYYWAIVVGLANTIFISALVIFFSSVLGLVVGITRLSSNPLAAGTCRVWVEIARNSPPIVLLIFLYSLWWKVLPPVGEALNPLPGVYASMRGFVVPAFSIDIGVTGATDHPIRPDARRAQLRSHPEWSLAALGCAGNPGCRRRGTVARRYALRRRFPGLHGFELPGRQ